MKNTALDIVELYLDIMTNFHSEELKGKTYKQIATTLNNKFDLNTCEEDVFLIYEPSISEAEEDLRAQFNAMGLYY